MRRTPAKWILVVLVIAVAAASIHGQRRGSTRGGADVLSVSDFTYVGAFALPVVNGTDTAYARGLTHRYVDGRIRLMTAGWNPNSLLEFAPPPRPSTQPPYPSALLVRNWGRDWHQGVVNGVIYGLFWDEVDRRLYWVSTGEYSASAHRRTLAYGSLDDDHGRVLPSGMFGFPAGSPGYKWLKGITAIPEQYQAALGGKRLAGGFGGIEAVVGAGGASMGPALVPFDHTALERLDAYTDLPPRALQILLMHPANSRPYTPPLRARRNPNYRQNTDGWHPRGGVGYWTWADEAHAGLWLDTGTKQGFLVWVRQAMGGESARYTAVSPAPEYGRFGRQLTLTSPLAHARVGDMIYVPDASGGRHSYVAARVRAVDGNRLAVTLQAVPGLNPSPSPPGNGEIWRGVFYYGAQVVSTAGRSAVFIYDSADLLRGTRPDLVDPVEEAPWPIPTIPEPIPSWAGSSPGLVVGATFDEVADRLYLLVRTAHPFPPVPTSRAMVFVYDVSGGPSRRGRWRAF